MVRKWALQRATQIYYGRFQKVHFGITQTGIQVVAMSYDDYVAWRFIGVNMIQIGKT